MMEHFKKGQIVPKRLGIMVATNQCQHRITFGCDVDVDGKDIVAKTPGYLFIVRTDTAARHFECAIYDGFSIHGLGEELNRAVISFDNRKWNYRFTMKKQSKLALKNRKRAVFVGAGKKVTP